MWTKLKKQIWEWRGVWITAPSVAALVVALRLVGGLQVREWAALDQYFRLRPLEPLDSRIVIVGIDEPDLTKLQAWPISDGVMARLLEKIKQQQPRAIGLDLYRNFPVQPGYAALVKVFQTTPNLIGIEKKIEDGGGSSVPPPPVLSQLGQVAANDVIADGDGKLRRALMYVTPHNGETIESLALRLALIYLEAENIQPQPAPENSDYLRLGKSSFRIFEPNDGGYVREDASSYQVLLNFRGPVKTFQTLSLSQVLADQVPPDLMKGKIVLVGATAVSLNDLFYTPYNGAIVTKKTPGVEVQANAISQILSAALEGRPLLKVWEDPLEILWILGWSTVGAVLSWQLRSLYWNIPVLLLSGVGLVGGCYLAFLSGWWLPVVPPLLALIGSAIANTAYIASVEREERQVVMTLFGRHVTPKIAEAIWQERDQLLQEGRLRGQRVTATVLFTDLKDFSTLSEQMEPEALMLWLNEYMEAMVQLVLDQGGIIDKFIGDAIMAVFGVPLPRTTPEEIAEDAQRAVSCALTMAARLETLNQSWASRHLPTAKMRVGISTGTVVIGSVGSSQRLEYTTIGDSVNVASRLESYDKSIGEGICRILISEATFSKTKGQFATKPMGSLMLKGREQAVNVYHVLLKAKADR